MNREEDKELWDLLGQARRPVLSPFFARNVVRQVRQEGGWRDRISNWFRPRRLIPVAGLATVVFGAALALQPRSTDENSMDDPPAVVASIDPEDFDAVADLDNLLAMEDDNLWADSSPL